MSCVYRCSRCRTRNTFLRPVSTYKREKKCRDCGYKKFYPDKERIYRVHCRCEGAYHWGPHRKGSKLCVEHPEYRANRALRDGTDEDEVAWMGLRLVLHNGDSIPF